MEYQKGAWNDLILLIYILKMILNYLYRQQINNGLTHCKIIFLVDYRKNEMSIKMKEYLIYLQYQANLK